VRIAVIVLAAGESSRLGSPKQLLLYQGETLLRRTAAAAAASACAPLAVVLGAAAEQMRPQLSGLRADVVIKSDWREGIASSIRAGIDAVRAASDAAIVAVCDQPFVSAEIFDRLCGCYRRARSPIVASAYGGTLGVPALFERALYAELAALKGDRGAKRIIERYADLASRVPFPGGEIDIDTRSDYAKLL
jgi:molybdenum cofactor cytidylyltransferase